MKKWILSLALASSLFSVSNAALNLSLSDNSIDWNEQKFITLTASGVTKTNLQFSLYADLNSNGVVDGFDPLVWQYQMSDNEPNWALDVFSLKDRNATNGTVEIRVSYHGMERPEMRIAGQYIWEVAEQNGGVTQTGFTVTPPVSSYVIEGTIENMLTPGVAPTNASFVFLESFMASDGPEPTVWAQPDGSFSICLPTNSISPDNLMAVGVVSLGYLSAEGDDEGGEEYSFHAFTNALSSGTNSLATPLKVVSAAYLPQENVNLITISGKISVDEGDETNTLAGAWVILDGDDADIFGFDLTDTNGFYELVVPAEEDMVVELFVGGYGVNIREVLGRTVEISGPSTNLTVNILCPEGEHMVSGTISNGLAGINVGLMNDDLNVYSVGSTESNGLYEVCVATGANWMANVGGAMAEAHGYPSVSFPVGTITQSLPNQNGILDEGALITGTVYDANTNALFGGEVYLQANDDSWEWLVDLDVNFAGEYELLIEGGTYRLGTDEFDGFIDQQISNLALTEGSTTNINLYLDVAAEISGRITTEGTNAYSECWIQVGTFDGTNIWYATSADPMEDGTYTVYVAPGSNYLLSVQPEYGEPYMVQYYSNATLSSEATLITTTLATGATNINFDLQPGALFTGTALCAGSPRSGTYVIGSTNNGTYWEETGERRYVDSDSGLFSLVLPAGSNYVIKAGNDWWDQWWISKYSDDVLRPEEATTFTVNIGDTTPDLNFDLQSGFRFNGHVQDHQTVNGIADCRVALLDAATGAEVIYEICNGNGDFYFNAPTGIDLIAYATHPLYAGEYLRDSYTTNGAQIIHFNTGTNLYEHMQLHALITDSDTDGVPDYQEDTVPDGFYSPGQDLADINNPDTDGDGQNDYQEIIVAGTSPSNPSDLFEISESGTTLSEEGFVLNWDAKPGRTYSVSVTTNLIDGFTLLTNGLSSGPYTNAVLPTDQQNFFKLNVHN